MMFQHQGIWLPEGEKHFPEWMDKNGEIVDGKGTYQYKKWLACIPFIAEWRQAVDVGAHVGFWSRCLAKKFECVTAFEPVRQFADCWDKNLEDVNPKDVRLYRVALGNRLSGRVKMKTPNLGEGIDSGGTHIEAEVGDDRDGVDILTLDSFDLGGVDFIKIDCEGYEHHVIEGARETLERCRPCVIVEQKPHKLGKNFGIKGTPAVDLLRSMGAEVRREIGGDYIMTWE